MTLGPASIFLIIMTALSAPPADHLDPSAAVPLIIDGGPACVIVYPGDSATDYEHARRIAEAIESLGTTDVPVIPDTEAVPHRLGSWRDDLQKMPLIILGNINNNRAVFSLYANYYTYCDARYPGGDGYAVHAIVRPFGRETNCLIVGSSTPAGMKAAVDHFVNRMRQLPSGRRVTVPYIHDIRLGTDLAHTLQSYLDEAGVDEADPPPGRGLYDHERSRFTHNAHLYFYTSNPVFAERARRWALQLARHDERGIRISDYDLENLVAAWRRVMFHPVVTAEDRQLFNTRLYETAQNLEESWWRLEDASQGIGGRHHTTGMLAWWTLIRVLLETTSLEPAAIEELTRWRHECEDYLDGLLRHYSDDLDDYQSADSAQNIASYALQTARLDWYDDGLARRAAQRVMAVTDNMGYYAGIQGYGEALPGWERFTLNAGLLCGSCAFVYGDESFRWPLAHDPALNRSWGALQPWGLHQFATDHPVPSNPPDWLCGSSVLRFTPYRLAQMNKGDFLNTPLMDGFFVSGLGVPDIADSSAFDKLVMRDRPDPSSLYLLLQGSAAIALSVIDMNAIIRLTDQGAIWLLHNTAQRSLYFKNAVYLTKGLNNEPLPPSCELIAQDDYAHASLAASRLSGYRDTTWTRHVITLYDHFAVVIDQVRADAPGEYHLCCTWRTPAAAELTDSAWRSQQNDVTFSLLPGEMNDTFSERASEREGATRPTILRQNRTFTASSGDNLFIENLMYTSGPRRTQDLAIRRVAPGVIVIRRVSEGKESHYLAAVSQTGIRAGKIRSNSRCLLIGPGKAWLSSDAERGEAAQDLRLELDVEKIDALTGELAFDPEQAGLAAGILKALWEQGHVPTTPMSDPSHDNMVHSPVWQIPGPSLRGGRIDGIRFQGVRHVTGPAMAATDWILPVLRAEPRLAAHRGSGSTFDPPPDALAIQTADIVLSPLAGAEFILDLPSRTRIDELILFGDVFDKNLPLPPAELQIEIVAEEDVVAPQQSRRKLTLTRQASWHNLYKGHCYLFECYRAAGLDMEAARLRVRILSGSSSEMLLSDVQVLAARPGPDQPVNVRTLDLDADGSDEILTWTSAGDVACIHHDGRLGWRDRLPAGIIALDAWDLDGDDRLEIFVSRTDMQIDVLSSDGTFRWTKDFSDMYRRTDELHYRDGSAVYGMAAWKPETADTVELIFTSYFFMARMNAAREVLEYARRSGHVTQIRSVPHGLTRGGDLVMRSDIAWVGHVPLEWWSCTTGLPDVTCNVPNGRIVHFDVDDHDRDGRAEALVATEEGIGLYSPDEPYTRWEHLTEAPPVGVGSIFDQPDAPAEIVYAREDGYLFVLEATGKLLRSTVLDKSLRCLTAIPTHESGSLILVGTPTSLVAIRPSDLTTLWRQPGRYQQFATVKGNDAGRTQTPTRVVAVTSEGSLEAFDF